jgi:AcrR family transcriptional regulator
VPRARPLSPAERRSSLVSATLPLLYTYGRDVTTRQIAEAAGVAEGTIFRVFDSKEALVAAALDKAFEPGELLVRVREIDPEQPLRDRLLSITSILQQRFRATFGLMRAMGEFGPPRREKPPEHVASLEEARRAMVEVVEPDAALLSVPPATLIHVLRLLTFAGSNEQIADGRLLTPDQIVDTLLHGVLTKEHWES